MLFVGLSTEQLEVLAKLGKRVRKTARRDIAHVVSKVIADACLLAVTCMIFRISC